VEEFIKSVFQVTSQHLTVKLELVYLENGSEFLSSGYAVSDSVIPEKGIVSYAPLRTLSCWGNTCPRTMYNMEFLPVCRSRNKRRVIGPFYDF
jgi:hypothetical protein